MKKVNVNLKTLNAIILLFGISLGLMAQPQMRNRQFNSGECRALTIMNLTEDQETQIREIHLAGANEIQSMKDELQINKAKINALVKKDDPDMKEITSLVETNGKIRTEMRVKQIDNRLKVRALLTDEQKIIFDARGNMGKGRMGMANLRQGRMNCRMPYGCRMQYKGRF